MQKQAAILCTGCARKNVPTCFCQNFVKSQPNLIIFGTQIAKTIELCEVLSLSTSHNLCQCTTV